MGSQQHGQQHRYPLALPNRMPQADRVKLCDRRRFVSFTFIRNPWDRLASAYLSKIDRGDRVRDRQALHVQQMIRELFGLDRGAHISFGHFVRWVVQQKVPIVTSSDKPAHVADDVENVLDFELSATDMARLGAIR